MNISREDRGKGKLKQTRSEIRKEGIKMKFFWLRNLCYAFGCDGKTLEWCTQESNIIRCVFLMTIFENWRLFLWLHRIFLSLNPSIILHPIQSFLASCPFLFRLNTKIFFSEGSNIWHILWNGGTGRS